jgi:hypothetical protein
VWALNSRMAAYDPGEYHNKYRAKSGTWYFAFWPGRGGVPVVERSSAGKPIPLCPTVAKYNKLLKGMGDHW